MYMYVLYDLTCICNVIGLLFCIVLYFIIVNMCDCHMYFIINLFTYLLNYNKVNQANLHGSFRQKVWIAELGGEKEAEVSAVLDDAVAKPQTQRAGLTECLSQQQWLQQRIHLCLLYTSPSPRDS